MFLSKIISIPLDRRQAVGFSFFSFCPHKVDDAELTKKAIGALTAPFFRLLASSHVTNVRHQCCCWKFEKKVPNIRKLFGYGDFEFSVIENETII